MGQRMALPSRYVVCDNEDDDDRMRMMHVLSVCERERESAGAEQPKTESRGAARL